MFAEIIYNGEKNKMIIAAVILFIVGIIMVLKPEVVYRITQSWKNDLASEPSDLYCLSTRIGGIALSSVGLVCFVILLFF